MAKFPSVKGAFCGCSLEEGSKIIAYIHMIGYTGLLITAIVLSWMEAIDPETEFRNETFSENSTNLTEQQIDLYHMEDRVIEEGFLALTSSYFNEMVFLIQVVFAVSLVIGIFKKNLDLIFSWILLEMTHIIFSQILVTVYFMALYNGIMNHSVVYLFFEEITLGVLEAYFIVVVNSYMKELTQVNEENDEVMSPIVINSSSVDLRYPEDTNNYVH
ncbi:uncharacterized protein [Halyomorpha halys]|uniref:uncharacterized protein n=1 Tax=Halyomorpha halys TaxID=286706 RepID=UPI0006D4F146|nr:uncharacterized protein LOC106681063 [Halyomorpha halys]